MTSEAKVRRASIIFGSSTYRKAKIDSEGKKGSHHTTQRSYQRDVFSDSPRCLGRKKKADASANHHARGTKGFQEVVER